MPPGPPRGASEDAAIPSPPQRWRHRLVWLGPGFLWMVSAAGSGELLFTPRIGALYGYALLWALIAAVAMKWLINREVGRWAVCTGTPVLEGFARLPGPRGWAVLVILGPQAVVAVATIAGLAGSAATALRLVLPGDLRFWMVASVLVSTTLVTAGRYKVVEKVAMAIAIALALAAIAAAFAVGPDAGALAAGAVPQVPPEVAWEEVLPWLGFALSGAAGMIWYSYWIQAKGYGAAKVEGGVDPARLGPRDRERLRGWVRLMTLDNTVAVLGTLIVTLAFLILGTELLRPQGLVPEEHRVAEVLGQLLGGVWGPIGFWFMILAVYVGFWDTVLSDQDGFGRMFGHGTRLLLRDRLRGRLADPLLLRRTYVLVLLTALPIALYLAVGEPVALLKLAGAIEAVHIPFLTALLLVLNARLPPGLRPRKVTVIATAAAGLFFAAFAGLYVWQALG